jgi:glycosyltransferase involved in cell wall biosynthesis
MIPYRLGLQQRVFPAYRAPFFDALARDCRDGLEVFAGQPLSGEALGQPAALEVARWVNARNLYLGWGPLLSVWQVGLLRWLEAWHPEVLVADINPRNLTTQAALGWMRAHRRPVIGWGLGAPAARSGGEKRFSAFWPFAAWRAASWRRLLRRFDALIAYSRVGAEQFIAAGCPPERVFVAPNAATLRPAGPPPERPPGYRDGRPSVLFVGRLQARKRVDALLRACAALPPALQPRLTIVGDGPARPDFEAVARSVYPAAVFAGARLGPDLEPYYAAADLFVLPGTGGLAVQQAMSSGLPVMVSEADGTQSDLVRPTNGWLLPPNDDRALAACLAGALADPARLRRMGAESYRIVREEVNVERMVEIFEDVIQRTGLRG